MDTRIASVEPPRLQTLKEATIEPLADPVTSVDVPAAVGVAEPRITYDAIYIPPNIKISGNAVALAP